MPVAREACEAAGAPDADLRYWKRSFLLNDCPLLKKARITYVCDRPQGAQPPGMTGD